MADQEDVEVLPSGLALQQVGCYVSGMLAEDRWSYLWLLVEWTKLMQHAGCGGSPSTHGALLFL